MEIFLVVLVVVVLIYEYVWRARVIERKIKEHIENIGGELSGIERIATREDIFVVNYISNGVCEKSTVKFNMFYEQFWF